MTPSGAPEGPAPEPLADLIEDLLERRPALATVLGLRDQDHLPPRVSASDVARQERADARHLEAISVLDPATLDDGQRLDRELALGWLRCRIATAGFEQWRRHAEEYLGDGVYELVVHGIRADEEVVAAATARLAAVPDTVAAAIANLEPSLCDPDLLRRDAAVSRSQADYVLAEVAPTIADPGLRTQLESAAAPAADAYRRLADHLVSLADQATGTYAFGESNYTSVLQLGEGLDLGVSDLAGIGETELESVTAEMNMVAAEIRPGSAWLEVVHDLQREHAADEAGMLAEYAAATNRARQFIIDHDLISLPDGEDCRLVPAPEFQRAVLAVASYLEPPRYGGAMTGRFFVPYCPLGSPPTEIEERLRSNASFEIPSTAAHETYPGHHVQLLRAHRAPLIREVITSTFMIEGWALYTERMMAEQGFFRTPEERLGQLSSWMLRAARVVVDTALHTETMDVPAATAFMESRAGLPHSVARAEVLRYAGWPTQASAYLTGAVALRRGRERWLGMGKPLRGFHDSLTALGSIPPGLALSALGL